jgi:SOS-response transcriptional repressor LexA
VAVKLTKKQHEMLEYIDSFIEEAGYSPTYREIMRGLGYKSVATVAKHIDNLVILGQLEKSENEARSVIVRKGQGETSEKEKLVFDYLNSKVGQLEKSGRINESAKIKEAIEILRSFN